VGQVERVDPRAEGAVVAAGPEGDGLVLGLGAGVHHQPAPGEGPDREPAGGSAYRVRAEGETAAGRRPRAPRAPAQPPGGGGRGAARRGGGTAPAWRGAARPPPGARVSSIRWPGGRPGTSSERRAVSPAVGSAAACVSGPPRGSGASRFACTAASWAQAPDL